ncbi:MAG: GatB/YqeY domain-containing protein [Candidatus Parcubacteria bacterium]|nr:GatB/YqeY domain-containing protein [Candidatus Parcubacteria bacterium]
MSILEQIASDFQQALKDRDMGRIGILRLINAATKNERIKKMADLTDEDVIKVLKSEIKKRKEAIVDYTKGARQDLIDKEQAEIVAIEKYLPQQMGEDELRSKIAAIIEALEEKDNIGKVMGKVMAELKGQADGTLVKKIVEELLNKEKN